MRSSASSSHLVSRALTCFTLPRSFTKFTTTLTIPFSFSSSSSTLLPHSFTCSSRSFAQFARSNAAPTASPSSSPSSSLKASLSIPTSHDPRRSASQQDKVLFTPGPLTTSHPVKNSMTVDFGSRDPSFLRVVQDITHELLALSQLSSTTHTPVIIQGSGTFGVEAVLSSSCYKHDEQRQLLLLVNGAYGERATLIAQRHGIRHHVLTWPENQPVQLDKVEQWLKESSSSRFSHVFMVHSETTSGLINDIHGVGKLIGKHRPGMTFVVDAISSFAAYPIDFREGNIHFLVGSPNKCLESVPGFSFILANKEKLQQCVGNASTVSLDIAAQSTYFASSGQFRFTPPTHTLVAFATALREYEAEGGVKGRSQRYQMNQRTLKEGMKKLGFELFLHEKDMGYIITSFLYPKDPNWNFETFYSRLFDRGFVIYPGKISKTDCFRIGHIGRIFPQDVAALVETIEEVCRHMKTANFYSPSN